MLRFPMATRTRYGAESDSVNRLVRDIMLLLTAVTTGVCWTGYPRISQYLRLDEEQG